ncbi:thiol-disulfide oxidoreductase DCC family protein [Malonomonas rubra]|uniref:thiol-disulfide oxidoreductase DCC family protein n=1 Tax=Malonomonas rubra TaxID=57040 RepID=UPI0026EB87D3|nr:DCC1-like thiol-disulfide oxidoreductase family protein [Malonomonas rubra]
MNEHPVLLFDGVCNLCSAAVQFIIKRDAGAFRFAAMQSPAGERLLAEHRLTDVSGETMVLIVGRNIYLRSDAALQVARRLNGAWALLYGFILLPRSWRESGYRLLANNRYRWFGRRQSCRLPSEEDRHRFLE